jgi:hypothetical protein
VAERASLVEKTNGCALCLDYTGRHQKDNCRSMSLGSLYGRCDRQVNGVDCGKQHNSLLHGATGRFCNYVQVNALRASVPPTMAELEAGDAAGTLLQVQRVAVECEAKDCLVFWDSGSNINLVTKGFIEKAGLQGRSTQLNLTTTGRSEDTLATTAYWVPLLDRTGEAHYVLAYEMDTITAPMSEVDVTGALDIIPDIPSLEAVRRPVGPVDLLVGLGHAGLFPYPADRERHWRGNLRLLTSRFGSGFLLDGEHPSVSAGLVLQSPESLKLSHTAKAIVGKGQSQGKVCNKVEKRPLFRFPECEEMDDTTWRSPSSPQGLSRTPWARASRAQQPKVTQQPEVTGTLETALEVMVAAVEAIRGGKHEMNSDKAERCDKGYSSSYTGRMVEAKEVRDTDNAQGNGSRWSIMAARLEAIWDESESFDEAVQEEISKVWPGEQAKVEPHNTEPGGPCADFRSSYSVTRDFAERDLAIQFISSSSGEVEQRSREPGERDSRSEPVGGGGYGGGACANLPYSKMVVEESADQEGFAGDRGIKVFGVRGDYGIGRAGRDFSDHDYGDKAEEELETADC